jgi:hypothetical protein
LESQAFYFRAPVRDGEAKFVGAETMGGERTPATVRGRYKGESQKQIPR